MTLKSVIFIATISGFVTQTLQSIAGVTYMDQFDFETRYRNVHECDPFYWHPLHLPEHCTRMFEKLIRNNVAQFGPARIVRERPTDSFNEERGRFGYNIHKDYSDDDDETIAPYERMIEMLKGDIVNEPIAPNITVLPGLGLVALYKQPVSRKSGDFIKSMARAYKDYSFKYGAVYYSTTQEPHLEVHIQGNRKKRKHIGRENHEADKETLQELKKDLLSILRTKQK